MNIIKRIYQRLVNFTSYNDNKIEPTPQDKAPIENKVNTVKTIVALPPFDTPVLNQQVKLPLRSIETLEKTIQKMAAEARKVADLDFESFDLNSKGEYIDAPERLYWETLVNVNELALRFRETAQNHYYLGHALLNLAEYKQGKEKESFFREAISNLVKSNSLNTNIENFRLIGVSYFNLGDILEGKESGIAYLESERNLKTYLDGGNKTNWIYSNLGRSICYQADEIVDLEEKLKRRKEGVSYLQQAVRLDKKDSYEHYCLGEELSCLADDSIEQGRKIRLYNHALRHLYKSYDLDSDPVTLDLIEEIMEDM